jgi:CspA family cold shock protein
MKGKIKWYKKNSGYGFILGDDGKDYFVHHSVLPENQEDIYEKDNVEVSFELKEGRDGRMQADKVKFEKAEAA